MKSKCNMDIDMDTDDEFLLVSRLIRVVIVGSDSSRNSCQPWFWHGMMIFIYSVSINPATQVQMMYII